MPRVVIDTNITVRYLLILNSSLNWLFEAFLQNKLQLVYSPALIQELINVLSYPRITRKYKLKTDEIKILIDSFYNFSLLIHPQQTVKICRDEKDNMLLEAALAGQAEYIITSDEDLLILKDFRGIKIVKPSFIKKVLSI